MLRSLTAETSIARLRSGPGSTFAAEKQREIANSAFMSAFWFVTSFKTAARTVAIRSLADTEPFSSRQRAASSAFSSMTLKARISWLLVRFFRDSANNSLTTSATLSGCDASASPRSRETAPAAPLANACAITIPNWCMGDMRFGSKSCPAEVLADCHGPGKQAAAIAHNDAGDFEGLSLRQAVRRQKS
jgi:hypothetical protein